MQVLTAGDTAHPVHVLTTVFPCISCCHHPTHTHLFRLRLGMVQSETLVKVQDVKLCVIQGNPNPRLPFGGQGTGMYDPGHFP